MTERIIGIHSQVDPDKNKIISALLYHYSFSKTNKIVALQRLSASETEESESEGSKQKKPEK